MIRLHCVAFENPFNRPCFFHYVDAENVSRFCHSCGNQVNPNDSFCKRCGTKQRGAGESGTSSTSPHEDAAAKPIVTTKSPSPSRDVQYPVARDPPPPSGRAPQAEQARMRIGAIGAGKGGQAGTQPSLSFHDMAPREALSLTAMGPYCWACATEVKDDQVGFLCPHCGSDLRLAMSPNFTLFVDPVVTDVQTKMCPSCVQPVIKAAGLCPYCGHVFVVSSGMSTDMTHQSSQSAADDAFLPRTKRRFGRKQVQGTPSFITLEELGYFAAALSIVMLAVFARTMVLSGLSTADIDWDDLILLAASFVALFSTVFFTGKVVGWYNGISSKFIIQQNQVGMSLILAFLGLLLPPGALQMQPRPGSAVTVRNVGRTAAAQVIALLVWSFAASLLPFLSIKHDSLAYLSQMAAMFAIFSLVPLEGFSGNNLKKWSTPVWAVLLTFALSAAFLSFVQM